MIVEALNDRSGKRSVEIPVSVADLVYNANITCPKAQVFKKEIECTGYVTRGAPHPIIFEFGDGRSEVIHSSEYILCLMCATWSKVWLCYGGFLRHPLMYN